MKAMILAAGRGERLRPLTDTTPKPLLKAGRKRLIEYLIDNLVKAGFDELVINHAHLGERFPDVLGDGSRYGASIDYSPELDGGLETAGGIIHALPLLGDEPFVVVNGDIWTDYDFGRLREFRSETDWCHLVMVGNPAHNPDGDFSLKNGLIGHDESQRYTFSGIGWYHPALFHGLDDSKRPLKPLLEKAIQQQRISGEYHSGEWSDIGTVERLEQLNQQLESGAE